MKTVFLNGYLKEEIYMEHHKGFMSEADSYKVCELNRYIYELKQASVVGIFISMKLLKHFVS